MKTPRIFFWALLMVSLLNARSQVPSPDSLMKKVLENNRTLRVAREAYKVSILEAGTGNSPPDPEVEFGYLFGKPSEIGSRIDFNVRQQVDFPTTYIHKSRLRKIKTTQAELEYVISRQDVLLQATTLWIEGIHLNLKETLLLRRLEQAGTIKEHFRNKLVAGEVGHLAFNQSNLQFATLESEYHQVLSEKRSNQLALNEISGGIEIVIIDMEFPSPTSIMPDSLLQAYLRSPALLLYQHEMKLKEEQKNLTLSQNLPKLSAGYYSESLLDQQFRGFQVGVTVPLWENSKRIRQAKSEAIFAEADAERYTYLQRKEIIENLDQLESIKNRSASLGEVLETGNSTELLTLALENGEISLSEYFYASDFYFRSEQQLLEYKRDQLILEARLLKVYL